MLWTLSGEVNGVSKMEKHPWPTKDDSRIWSLMTLLSCQTNPCAAHLLTCCYINNMNPSGWSTTEQGLPLFAAKCKYLRCVRKWALSCGTGTPAPTLGCVSVQGGSPKWKQSRGLSTKQRRGPTGRWAWAEGRLLRFGVIFKISTLIQKYGAWWFGLELFLKYHQWSKNTELWGLGPVLAGVCHSRCAQRSPCFWCRNCTLKCQLPPSGKHQRESITP